MPRLPDVNPSYLKHKASGRARVVVRDHNGNRKSVLLPGKFRSKESLAEYDRICAQVRANRGRLAAPANGGGPASDLTISELILKFMEERVVTYYVDPITKKPLGEQATIKAALRPLNRMAGSMLASEFGPLALQRVREAMITGAWLNPAEVAEHKRLNRPIGLARSTTNKAVSRIRLLFNWAASQELIPASVSHGLKAVEGLRRGRSAARETDAVTPVAESVVYETLPHLQPVVRDLAELLLLTGMRVGEACVMRAADLDTSGEVWIYKPERHKNAYRGHERHVAIGPRAQEIVRRYLKPQLDAYLFSPAEQRDMIFAAKRAARRSPVQPSQRDRKRPNGKRKPKDRFTATSVNRAIRRACEKAGIEPWHVHQLRHAASLLVAREFGLEHARAVLGHRHVQMSAHYAGIDVQAAKTVAAKIG